MTKLRDLDATFVRHTGDGNFDEVAAMADANGVMFDCPKCGRHSVLVWDQTIPTGIEPGPGRWIMTGSSLDDLTLSPSVNLPKIECAWHGWIKNGDAA